jgi:membrane fusion protein, multidrug efflux system
MDTPGVLERPTVRTTEHHQFQPPPERPKRSLWWLWLLLLAALFFGGYKLYQAQVTKRAANAAAVQARAARRSTAVVIATARQGNMPVTLRGLGSVAAFQTVTVRSRVDGQLINVAFREGQFVHQGDLLAEIDPRTYQVQLAQAEGQLARDQAQLKDAQVNLERYKQLFSDQVIARQQLDTQASLVGQFEGAIQGDKAAIDQAKLQLVYCRITAPLSGRIGLRQVDQGNIVHASDATGIATITQLQPIAVLFSIPEDYLPQVLKRLRANPNLPVDAYDRNGTEKLANGTLLTVDNQIDPTTGTSKLKAVFNNSDNTLFPNQFVNVELRLDTRQGAIIVPAAAVQRGPQGSFVYLVKEGKAFVRPVTTGLSQGNDVSIDKGLASGDQVVVDGADKLTDGTKVDIRQPGNNAAPRRPRA